MMSVTAEGKITLKLLLYGYKKTGRQNTTTMSSGKIMTAHTVNLPV
jgi:hypothetical protein